MLMEIKKRRSAYRSIRSARKLTAREKRDADGKTGDNFGKTGKVERTHGPPPLGIDIEKRAYSDCGVKRPDVKGGKYKRRHQKKSLRRHQ